MLMFINVFLVTGLRDYKIDLNNYVAFTPPMGINGTFNMNSVISMSVVF